MRIGKLLLPLILHLLVSANCLSFAATTHLKIGLFNDPPKAFRDTSGQPSGIAIDILRRIAEIEDWELEFVSCEVQRCFELLEHNEIDLLPDVTYSEERGERYGFHRIPLLHSWYQLYRHRDIEVMSIPDLNGKKIAVTRGSIQETYLLELLKNFGITATLVSTATSEVAFQLVADRKADVLVSSNFAGDIQASRYRLLDTPIMFHPSQDLFATPKDAGHRFREAIDHHLGAWQKDPESFYFNTLRNWQGRAHQWRVPLSFWWGLGTVALVMLLALLFGLYQRRQVATKTHDLWISEHKRDTILNSIESLIYIKGLDYRYEYVNDATCRILGRSAGEILGRSDEQLLVSELVPAIRAQDRRVIEHGERVVSEQAGLIYNEKSPLTYLSTKIPLRDRHGVIYALCGISTDITVQKNAEDALRIAATVFESQVGMFVCGSDTLLIRVNHAFTIITGYSQEHLIGHSIPPLALGVNEVDCRELVWQQVTNHGKWQGEVRTHRKAGDAYTAWLTLTAVHDAAGHITHYVGTYTDITERKMNEEKIVELAYYDSLTGLPNRRLLLDRIAHRLAVQARTGTACALLFIDLDNFKYLNDAFGHHLGDSLLQQVAQRIENCTRKSDTVARLGGDEFVVLLEDIGTSEEEAARYATNLGLKILSEVRKPFTFGQIKHHTTCSIGAVLGVGNHGRLDDLLKHGDLAMYDAKKQGRDTLCFFEREMEEIVAQRITLESEIRVAITESQFLLNYQSQVDNRSQLQGVEALLRWKHPRRGEVNPGMFIEIAESSGLILPLGLWALRAACQQMVKWASCPELAHLTVSVNVSVRQFRHVDFVPQVCEIIEQTGADPSKLKLEITETVLVEHPEDTIGKMRALKERGIGFSLDDFGTGYSSLSYLKKLPFDQLKIDRSFVNDIVINPNDAAIARSIVALAKALELKIVAEGVETEAQRCFLAELGCDAYQGYLFGRPVDASMVH